MTFINTLILNIKSTMRKTAPSVSAFIFMSRSIGTIMKKIIKTSLTDYQYAHFEVKMRRHSKMLRSKIHDIFYK